MKNTPKLKPLHPGQHIKEAILPKDLSVKAAAEILGVGRPALSNLLNGNAALTPEMAMRIERAFGAKAGDLLAFQMAYEEYQGREQAKEMAVRTYVPSFLGIEARQLSAWAAGNIEARAELPVLLRRLIYSTGVSLSKVDFPAYDNSQRHGWDGYVSSDQATPWIPTGNSGWEFGCDKNPERKAESDFVARKDSIAADERSLTTFIFVTPHNWPGKDKWAKEKRAANLWKDVRAYDASDLEQWLEQSIPTQAWFCEKIGSGAEGIASLDECWIKWANASEPPLSKILFRSAITASQGTLQDWLNKPPVTPLVITADSSEEALAFLACALEEIGKLPGSYKDRALVLKTVEALKRTTALASDFIAIVNSPEVEAATASVRTTHHVIIVRHRNEISDGPDIALDLVDDQTYREALGAMGLHEPDFPRYFRETANSPTILRRRLSKIPAIKTPKWSTDKAIARHLIPLNFAGVWNAESKADREIISFLAEEDQAVVEQTITELRTVPDAPVWSIGRYRGITSKIDVLFATHNSITKKDLENFFLVVQIVLSETDPALDLPQDQQWMANVYGKTREHSAGLRNGLCETLVLLAAHGNDLLQERLGVDVQAQVNEVIRALLLPLDARTWASQKSDLPQYAEAAPEIFLDILEQDLASPEPKVHALLRPAETALFGGCPRSGLLWAIETLAWKPDRLLRLSLILAKLAEIPIKDNWSNKPAASLGAIYRSWMPQTAATIEERNAAMEAICRRHPKIGWQLIMDQFGNHHGVGTYSARPHWRNEASGAGKAVKTYGEVYKVADKARELALSWPRHDHDTIGDLLERLHDMREEDQERVWGLVNNFAASDAPDAARHALRERVRRTAFARRARIRGVSQPIEDRARVAYSLLAPRDLVMRHFWLFAQHWVDESADEIEENYDYHKREARVSAQRKTALTEIWQTLGYDGVLRLCELSAAENAIGGHLVDGIITDVDQISLLDRLINQRVPPAASKIDNLISGFLRQLQPSVRVSLTANLLKRYVTENAVDNAIRLLKCSSFRADTWAYVEQLPNDWQQQYWKDAYVRWEGQEEGEFNTLVARLLEVDRAAEAFHAVHMDFNKVETKLLARLLRTLATSQVKSARGTFQFAQYEVSEAFKSLRKRPDVDRMDLVQLEFMYVSVLDHSDYGIPTLEEALVDDPQLFMQLVALVYKRDDGGQDPPEWVIEDEDHHRNVATNAFSIFHRMARIPGTQAGSQIDADVLSEWIDRVRALARTYGRSKPTDVAIGEMLGRCGADSNGVWPCEPVRQVIDSVESPDMVHGMSIGRFNTRGAHFRGPNGDDERGLAAQYRGWAKAVAFQYPFTAKMLEDMARSYEREAVLHDTEENVRKRLNY